MSETRREVDDWMAELGGLGDRWGRVDLTALGDVAAGDIQGSMTGSGDPRDMLDMLGEASDTEDLGADVIDGVEVHGTRFVVSLDEQGTVRSIQAELCAPRFVNQLLRLLGEHRKLCTHRTRRNGCKSKLVDSQFGQ